VDDRASNTGGGPKALFDWAVACLLERRVLLPGVTILARLISRVRDEAMQRMWDVMASMLTVERARLVERLLENPEGARVPDPERLRKAPRPPSGRNLVKSLDRVAEVAGFDVLMTTDLLARAERESKVEKLRRYPRPSKDAAKCAAAVEVMLASTEWGKEITIELLWDAIESVVTRAELRTAVTNLNDIIPPPDAGPNGDWQATPITRFAAVRGFLPLLTKVVAFGLRPPNARDKSYGCVNLGLKYCVHGH